MKLGKNQAAIYKALLHYGSWHRSCGWTWSSNSATEQLLNSLVKRGLARKEPYIKSLPGIPNSQADKYVPVTPP